MTDGLGAHGIKAQSIGGGGGNGGLAIVAQLGVALGSPEQATKTYNAGVSVGGAGGTGGYGNTVHVINDGAITVGGATATGIFAQSVGGGGGDGGGAISAIGMLSDSANSDSRSVVATVTVGGSGGSGNYGGAVTVDNTGSVVTSGVSGYGVFAQSIGGGGGIGGRANTIQMIVTKPVPVPNSDEVLTNKNNVKLALTIGGDGGTGGYGGDVVVNNEGTIETWGELSDGIYAQSVGAGGGNGGNGALGPDGLLPVPGGTKVLEKALGIFGVTGAVKAYKDISVTVGGSAGSSGDGGTVEVNNDQDITTHGSNSIGITAQSIGGGGGIGGKAVIGATGTLGLGGEGGGGGDGGEVTVDQTDDATIETFGVASLGIFAQSVGGGGGVAGNIDRLFANDMALGSTTIPALNVGAGLALGRSGGDGGNGGVVDVDVDGDIITHGHSAGGIFAQSVGGGGGMLGELGNDFPDLEQLNWQIGSKGDVGNADQIDVDLTGTISTSGNSATGIFAQSAAGVAGGGNAGTAGNVNVTVNGSVLTGAILDTEDGTLEVPLRGLGSIGIMAQSVAGDNALNGNVVVDINGADAIVRGGRSEVVSVDDGYVGVGVWIIDGKTNSITNDGLITTLGGVNAGYAILATGSDTTHTGGDEAVSNFGTVTGSFDLGVGANSFTNQIDALLDTGSFAYVGDGNPLSNSGRLAPGADGFVLTTEVTGDWTQTADGTYGIDLDLWQTDIPDLEADRVNVITGGTADLDGITEVGILNPGNALPGDHLVTIVTADGTVSAATEASLALVTPPSAVAMYELEYPDDTTINLAYEIDFAPDGLNDNQTAFGEQINEIQLTFPRPPTPGADPDTPLSPLVAALFELPDLVALEDAYDQLGPSIYTQNETLAIFSSLTFSDQLQSCRTREGDYRFVREGECAWLSIGEHQVDRERTDDNIGFTERTFGIAGGGQWAVNEDVRAGIGFSVETSSLETDTNASAGSMVVQGGGVLKGRFGGTTFSTSFSGGYGTYDSEREIEFPGVSEDTRGEQKISHISVHSRFAHAFESASSYIRPMVDTGITQIAYGALEESGSDLVGLSLDAGEQAFLTIEPSVEIGSEFTTSDGTLFRPYAQFGLTQFVGDASPSVAAVLQQAPAGVSHFITSDDFSKTLYNFSAGINVLAPSGMATRIEGVWTASNDTQKFGGSMKLWIPLN